MKSYGTYVLNFDWRFWVILSVLWPTVKVLETGERVYTCVRTYMKKERA